MISIPNEFNDFVKNKTVAIVGPGINLYNADKGNKIESFDIVARVGDFILLDTFNEKDWGKRTDIAFSNCNLDSRDAINNNRKKIIKDKGIKMMIGVQSSSSERQVQVDFLDGISKEFNIYTYLIPMKDLLVFQDFCEMSPLSGINSLLFLCSSCCSKIKIFGMNMYNNGNAGMVYHPDISKKQIELGFQNKNVLTSQDLRFDIHNPSFAIKSFSKLLDKFSDRIEVEN